MGKDRQKDDFLKECLSEVGTMPLDQFQGASCRLCANRQCARSGLGNSAFDRRVGNWQDTLFLNVARADEGDPRYSNIRMKQFVPAAGTAYEVRQEPGPPVIALPPEIVQVPAEPTGRPQADQPPEEAAISAPELQPAPPDAPPTASPQPVPDLGNTPFSQGSMVRGPDQGPQEIRLESGGTYVLEDD